MANCQPKSPSPIPLNGRKLAIGNLQFDNQYNGFVAEAKPFRLTESVKAAG
jgi:hypothetical protein